MGGRLLAKGNAGIMWRDCRELTGKDLSTSPCSGRENVRLISLTHKGHQSLTVFVNTASADWVLLLLMPKVWRHHWVCAISTGIYCVVKPTSVTDISLPCPALPCLSTPSLSLPSSRLLVFVNQFHQDIAPGDWVSAFVPGWSSSRVITAQR